MKLVLIFTLVIIFIIFIIDTVGRYSNNNSNNKLPFLKHKNNEITLDTDAKVAVIIPCIPKHYHFLPECIESINNQTLKPQQIIVCMSETLPMNNNSIKSELIKYTNIDIFVDCVYEKQYAGENRNRGYYHLYNDIEYVTFFDADDIMVDTKIQDTIFFMKLYNSNALLHSYSNNKIKTNNIVNVLTYDYIKNNINDNDIDKIYNFNHVFRYLNNIIHRGHITITKNVFDNIKYTNLKRGQDQQFIYDIIKNNYKVIFIDKILSVYNFYRSSTKI